MEMDNLLILVSVFLLIHGVHVTKGITTYYMEDQCEKEISMILDSVYQGQLTINVQPEFKEKSLYSFIYNKPLNSCKTNLESWYHFDKLMFYFDSLDLDCEDGYLEFYDGPYTSERISGLNRRICGLSKPDDVYTTQSRTLVVKYTPIRKTTILEAFRITFTAYSTGYCGIYYECDNKRCIHKTITCNDYNSCGDYSDCQTTLEAGAIAGIVVGSVFGLILIVSALVSFFCCLRPKKSSPGQTINQPVYFMNTSNVGQQQCNISTNTTTFPSGTTTAPPSYSQVVGEQPYPIQQVAYPSNNLSGQTEGQKSA